MNANRMVLYGTRKESIQDFHFLQTVCVCAVLVRTVEL